MVASLAGLGNIGMVINYSSSGATESHYLKRGKAFIAKGGFCGPKILGHVLPGWLVLQSDSHSLTDQQSLHKAP